MKRGTDMLARKHHDTREEWLISRNKIGIGASEAAAVVGRSPWTTPMELWRMKTSGIVGKDLSDNEAAERGNALEPVLRDLYAALHPTVRVEHSPYDILYQEGKPYIFATLDGEIVREDGARGILEIKTSSPQNKAKWAEWEDRIPDHYYIQLLHQFLATGFQFAILYAALFDFKGNITIKEYEIDAEECAADMEWLLAAEDKFYTNIKTGTMPPIILTI